MITSGVGIRQCSRNLRLSLRCTELKLRKIGRHLRRLNLNLQGNLVDDVSFHFDELESYEGQRNTRPLSIPVMIESKSRFIVWAESAPIRPRGKMSKKRLRAIENSEVRHGLRKDLSSRSIARTFHRVVSITQFASTLTLETDEKAVYPRMATSIFKNKSVMHNQTSSKIVRATWNPLFAINNEEAIMRDLMGRLRRESWLTSKKRRYLDIALQVHIAYRNLVRRRFNYDPESPAQILKFLPRRLRPTELLSWRQDWANRSIHPLSSSGLRLIQGFTSQSLAA